MTTVADIHLIRRALPHRFPFLLIDRVVDFVANERIVALKNITISEPQFSGHFPNYPIMPGVLLLEALAQACGVMMFMSSSLESLPEKDYLLLIGIDECRFRQKVFPGDQVFLHAELKRKKKAITRFQTRAEVEGKIVCEAILTSAHHSD